MKLDEELKKQCEAFFKVYPDPKILDEMERAKSLGEFAIAVYRGNDYYKQINQLLRGLAVNLPDDTHISEHAQLAFLFLVSLVLMDEMNQRSTKILADMSDVAMSDIVMQPLFRTQGVQPSIGLQALRGARSTVEDEYDCLDSFPESHILEIHGPHWMAPSINPADYGRDANEHIISHGTLFRMTGIQYRHGIPRRFYLKPSHSLNTVEMLPPEEAYFIRMTLREVHRKILSKPYSDGVSRSNHDTFHVLRKLAILEKLVLFLKKHGNWEIQPLINEMNYDDMFWVKLALIFSITGRDGECSSADDPQLYAKYKQASSRYYVAFIDEREGKYPSVFWPDALKDRFTRRFLAELLANSQSPLEYIQSLHGKHTLIACLVHMAHCLDLIRCYSKEEYDTCISRMFAPFVIESQEQVDDLELLKKIATLHFEKTAHLSCENDLLSKGEIILIRSQVPSFFKIEAPLFTQNASPSATSSSSSQTMPSGNGVQAAHPPLQHTWTLQVAPQVAWLETQRGFFQRLFLMTLVSINRLSKKDIRPVEIVKKHFLATILGQQCLQKHS